MIRRQSDKKLSVSLCDFRTPLHKGDIIWDTTKPDGTPRKLMDVSVEIIWMGIYN
jgi:hypothetical protein